MARPKFTPTEEQRRQVKAAAGFGLRHFEIAALMGVAEKTLRKHFRPELNVGSAITSFNVRKNLYERAISPNCIAATIFWVKTHSGPREPNDGQPRPNPPAIVVEVEQPTPSAVAGETESSPGEQKEGESLDLPDEDGQCE